MIDIFEMLLKKDISIHVEVCISSKMEICIQVKKFIVTVAASL